MSSSWNSSQAARYQRVVQPAGNQVPSQRVAKELVTTVAIMARRLRTKKPVTPQTAAAPSFPLTGVSRTMASPFPAGGRAAVEQAARGEHGGEDEKLNQ